MLNLGASWGWVANATPRLLYPRERERVPIVQEAGWASGPAWTGAENLDRTGIRSQDRPAHFLILYQNWILTILLERKERNTALVTVMVLNNDKKSGIKAL